MTTSTKELIERLEHEAKEIRGAMSHGVNEWAENCEAVAQRLRELDAQVTELELKLLTERGAKAWKDVPSATAFVEELRGNSVKPDCVWTPLFTTIEKNVNFYKQRCVTNIMVREMPTKLTPFCSNCGGAVKSGGTPNE
jgi:hypothetical protein